MIVVYGYVPAWGLPDISPYVTKLIYFLTTAKISYEYKSQDLAKLDTDAPFGKLPYIIDTDTNTKLADSNTIIEYLTQKHSISLDKGLSQSELAIALAFDRLAGEHLYWSGVIQPRWRDDAGWEVYIPHIVQGATVTPELRAALDAFRGRIVQGSEGHGMGRRDEDTTLQFYKTDIDALSAFLGYKKFFMGDHVRTVDMGLYAMLRHLTGQPQRWKGTGYVESKSNLVDYLKRMEGVVGI